MALASTCRMLNTEIEKCMLVVDAQHDVHYSEEIPIFFADHCHSVFTTYVSHGYSILDIWSWQQEPPDRRDCRDVAFRHDPSRKFKFSTDCGYDDGRDLSIELRKQFMTSEVTPAMKRALSACLNMGTSERVVWYPIKRDLKEHEWTRFFMKLFLLGCKSMSEESSPIRTFFESGETETETEVDNSDICLIPQIINLFEQTLEQKEPIHCVKRPLSAEEIERYSWHPAEDMGTRDARTDELPELCLEPEFTWKQCKRKHCDHEEDNQDKDELVFIARIPLAPNTARISLKASTKTDSSKLLFVIFFQKRHTGLESLENAIEGKVFNGDITVCEEFDLEPEYDACFLYFVPGNATEMEMTRLRVCLHVVLDKHNKDLWRWIRVLDEGYCDDEEPCQRLLPIALLRAGALALLGPDQEQKTEWKNAFDMAKLDSTPEDLERMVDVCNVLLEEWEMIDM